MDILKEFSYNFDLYAMALSASFIGPRLVYEHCS